MYYLVSADYTLLYRKHKLKPRVRFLFRLVLTKKGGKKLNHPEGFNGNPLLVYFLVRGRSLMTSS